MFIDLACLDGTGDPIEVQAIENTVIVDIKNAIMTEALLHEPDQTATLGKTYDK